MNYRKNLLKLSRVFLLFINLSLGYGCRSSDLSGEINGMVFSSSGECLGEAGVYLDGVLLCQSDSYGHFRFPSESAGEKKLVIKKKGYEEATVDYPSVSEPLFYITMISDSELLKRSTDAFKNQEYEACLDFAGRCRTCTANRNLADCCDLIECAVLYKQDKTEECRKACNERITGPHGRIYSQILEKLK